MNDFYIFDPNKLEEWECLPQNGTPPEYRAQHIMVHLSDQNQILIHGGNNPTNKALKDVYLFDYQTFQWTKKNVKDSIALTCHSAAYYEQSNTVFMYGGGDQKKSHMQLYMLNTNNWKFSLYDAQKIQPPRIGQISFIYEDVFYSFGGYSPKCGYLNELIAINIQFPGSSWEIIETVGENEKFPKGGLGINFELFESKIYIFGGLFEGELNREMWFLNIEKMAWKSIQFTKSKATFLYGHTLNFIDSSKIFIFGGSSICKNTGVDNKGDLSYIIKLKAVALEKNVEKEEQKQFINLYENKNQSKETSKNATRSNSLTFQKRGKKVKDIDIESDNTSFVASQLKIKILGFLFILKFFPNFIFFQTFFQNLNLLINNFFLISKSFF